MSSLQYLADLDAIARLAARDESLFGDDAAVRSEVAANLGWVSLPSNAERADLSGLRRLLDSVTRHPLDDVVLLGMGGSSLAARVLRDVIGRDLPGPRFHVLDTVAPRSVTELVGSLDPATTLVLVASKSGSTLEPLALYAILRDAFDAALGREAAGAHFVALTDAGSPLEVLARAHGFASVITTPGDVGGRYSALTAFGMAPAHLMGVDTDELMRRGAAMEHACQRPHGDVSADGAEMPNPAAALAAFAVDNTERGRDKLTLVSSPGLRSLGLWVEQLVAESLGKEGTGILPVVDLDDDKPFGYSPDRAVVIVRYAHDDRLEEWGRDLAEDHPVHEIVLADASDIAAEFVRWEYAVALMGLVLGVCPFGQPDVAAAKTATNKVLAGDIAPLAPRTIDGGYGLSFSGGLVDPDHVDRTIGAAIGHGFATLEAFDFVAILAYLPDDEELLRPIHTLVPYVSAELGVAITLEMGPRYLHSTGQYHKGGPNEGLFVMVTTSDSVDIAIPGQSFTLGELHRAQAEGDLVTLSAAGRRVVRVNLPDASPESIDAFVRGLADAAGVVYEQS